MRLGRSWLAGVFALACGAAVLAQGTDAPAKKVPPKPTKMTEAERHQENWKLATTPGTEQKVLESFVGRWTSKATVQVDPSRPAEETTGSAEGQMLLGGRFVEVIHKGTVMGQPFEGRMLMGYDNIAKKYVAVWVDNMGTAITHYDGTYDKKMKRLMMGARFVDPMTRRPVNVRSVTSFADPASWAYEEYTKGSDGKERLTLKITFRKA